METNGDKSEIHENVAKWLWCFIVVYTKWKIRTFAMKSSMFSFWAQEMSFYSLVYESIPQLSIYKKRTKPSNVATWTYWIYKTQQKAIVRRIDTLWSYLWNWRTSGAMYDGVPQTVSTYSPGRTDLTLYARQKRCQVSQSSSIKINK